MTMRCKIRVIKDIDVFPQYRPKQGKVYDAEYVDSSTAKLKRPPVCIVNIAGKRIVIRRDEFEIVGCSRCQT